MSYQFSSRVRYSEVGENGRLTLPSLLNYFQDCGTFEGEDVGLSMWKIKEMKKAWVLAAWQVDVKRFPVLGEEFTITTFPYSFRGVIGMRNYYIETKDQERLACANAFWTFFDTELQMPSKITEDIIENYTLGEKLDMKYASRKIQTPKDMTLWDTGDTFAIQKHHLDTNHHVNNVQYISMAEDFLPKGFKISQMRAEYRAQSRLGDVIYPLIYQEDEKVIVSLANAEKNPYAVVEFTSV